MNYSDKLKDPRWQKKRLEILTRDNFCCQYCGDSKTELQVHHIRYNGDPWKAKNKDLITFCKWCHQIEEWAKRNYYTIKHVTRAEQKNSFVTFEVCTESCVAVFKVRSGTLDILVVIGEAALFRMYKNYTNG